MKKVNNNKGAAMVTVLIAITFIGVLATSLIYMAYMNYLTKGLRYASTDNFYVDEFALDDLSTTIQQIAANEASVADAKDAVVAAVGGGTCGSGAYVYDHASVASLIQVASKEASISVNTAVEKNAAGEPIADNLIVEASYIKLVGVQIIATTPEGYQSTITSDITLSFPGSGVGEMDINDFSVITDSPISVVDGDVVFGGNIYLSKPISGGGDTALTVGGTANVGILSTRGIINGDVIINGTGFLNITGEITVLGDIYVRDDAVLMCTGDLTHSGEIHKSSRARVIGISPTEFGADTIDTSGIPGGGITPELFEEVMIYSTENGGGWHEMTVDDIIGGNSGWAKYKDSLGTEEIVIGMGTESVTNGLSNMLVLSTTPSITVRGDFSNSTIVTEGTIIFDIASAPTYMLCMTDETYEFAKETLVGTGGRNEFGYTLTDGYFNLKFSGGRQENMPEAGDAGVESYSETTASGGTIDYIYYDGRNYLPVGWFIVDNSSEVISRIFASVQGTSSPTDTRIFYERWSKN